MKLEKVVAKVVGLLMLFYFVWDSKKKYGVAEDTEIEKFRIRFS